MGKGTQAYKWQNPNLGRNMQHTREQTQKDIKQTLTRDKGKLRLYTKPEDTSKAIKGKRNRWETKNS